MDILAKFHVGMQRNSVRWKLVFYTYFVCGSHVSIVVPENKAVIVGQRMEMNCPTNDGLIIREWRIQRNFSSKSEVLYSNWQNNSKIVDLHFGIDTEGNIYTNSSELDDAGIYTCVAQLRPTQSPSKYSAQLIVFGKEPQCNISLAANDARVSPGRSFATMHCFATFRGFWSPAIAWRLHYGNREADVQGGVITERVQIIEDTNNSSTLITSINSTKYGHFYSCKFYFTAGNYKQITNATNIPDFSYTWNSSAFGILQNNSNSSTQDNSNSSAELPTIGWRNTYLIYFVVAFLGITLVAINIIVYFKRKKTTVPEPLNDLAANPSNRDNPVPTTHYVVHGSARSHIENDGTEYMQMNALGVQPASIGPTTTPGMFSLVEVYASIDHNCKIPPPTPRQRF